MKKACSSVLTITKLPNHTQLDRLAHAHNTTNQQVLETPLLKELTFKLELTTDETSRYFCHSSIEKPLSVTHQWMLDEQLLTQG